MDYLVMIAAMSEPLLLYNFFVSLHLFKSLCICNSEANNPVSLAMCNPRFLLTQKNLITSILYSTMRLACNNSCLSARKQCSCYEDFI